MEEAFFLHVMVIPFGIWGILMERGREEPNPKRQLRIRMAGNVGGGGAAAINASVETIEGFVGGGDRVEVQESLVARGVATEAPAPTYGYLRKNDVLFNRKDDDLISDWVGETLEGLVYTDRYGRNAGVESFLCPIPIEHGCVCRYHMRYTRGIKAKVDQWG